MERTTSSPQPYDSSAYRKDEVYAPKKGTDLGREVLGWRILASVVRGDVNETVDIIFGGRLCNAFSTIDVNIGVGEIPA